jgi:carbonyl reductase 1
MPTAFVTGANKGIGYEVALQLATQGLRVVLGCRDEGRALAAVRAIEAAVPAAAVSVIPIDLDDAAAIAAAAQRFAKENPAGLDVLVNNAAFAFKMASTVDAVEQSRVTMKINYTGHKAVCDAFFPLLNAKARVVNVGSRAGVLQSMPAGSAVTPRLVAASLTPVELDALVAAFVAIPAGGRVANGWMDSGYGASKAAVIALSGVHARDASLVQRGVAVNVMCPGYCNTDMTSGKGPKSAADGADTAVWLATSAAAAGVTGDFFGERVSLAWADYDKPQANPL